MSWEKPITLNAGDACWIHRGWWHCVEAEAEGVAVQVEVVSGCVRGIAPRKFGRVGSCKQIGRSVKRMVSRRPGWSSANSVMKQWAHAIEVCE